MDTGELTHKLMELVEITSNTAGQVSSIMDVIRDINDRMSRMEEVSINDRLQNEHLAALDKEVEEIKSDMDGYTSRVDKKIKELEDKITVIENYPDKIISSSTKKAFLYVLGLVSSCVVTYIITQLLNK